jgi:murein DD-endopeptidase MepM/ murein hydrolase activator NlpD
MKSPFIDPIDLPLTPPMDLNHGLKNIDKISPFPMQLRTRASVGLFEARREAGIINGRKGLIRAHHGIDLLAPKGTKVYAAADGKVIKSGGSIQLLHDYGFRFLTVYNHILNKLVNGGDSVVSGQEICEVDDNPNWKNETHLHFELRYPFENANPSYANSLPIDPTFAMYQWEVKSFQNDDEVRHEIDKVHIISFEEIIRGRQLRFIRIKVEGNNRNLYLPIQTGLQEDHSLEETLRQAFFAAKKICIVWRESLFFSKIQTTYDKVSIITEVKIYKQGVVL